MNVAIDTCSLLSLVRYYLPFDKHNKLNDFFKSKILAKEILVLDKVYDECTYTARGIVTNTLNYLNDKANHTKTIDLLPDKKFFNLLENQFINASIKNKLLPIELENRKNEYLESADAKLLLYCYYNKEIVIVSEETEAFNDNKAFKKIPANCKILEREIITLPKYLEMADGINLEFR